MFFAIVQEWTHGKPCLVIGLIQFLSSQASVLMLCILAVGRMVSVDQIGGMQGIKSKLWKFCIGAWVASLIVGLTYIVLIISHDLGAHNNLCITFGISNNYQHVTIFELAYQLLFIGCNSVIVAIIITSMVYMYIVIIRSGQTVKRVAGGRGSKSRNTMLVKIGRRLFLILICNIISWLPFLVVSCLLLAGVRMHDYIVHWVTILGVPICALTDPFLYNICPLRSYINRKGKDK
jgi:hypothetical protein